jgi:hypothetical protein
MKNKLSPLHCIFDALYAFLKHAQKYIVCFEVQYTLYIDCVLSLAWL